MMKRLMRIKRPLAAFMLPAFACMDKRLTGMFFCLLLMTTAKAQTDGIGAIQKILDAYHSNHTIHFNSSMKMYAKNNPGKIIEKMQSSYIMKRTNYVCSIGPVEMLSNDNYYVSVDKSNRMIMIGRQKDLLGTRQSPVLNIGQLATFIKEKKIAATVTVAGNNAILQLKDLQGVTGYDFFSIEYAGTTGYMKKVTIESNSVNGSNMTTLVLEIDYTPPVMTGEASDAFSEKPFFSVVNNKIQLAPGYKRYQLVNGL